MNKSDEFFLKNKCNLVSATDLSRIKKNLILKNKDNLIYLKYKDSIKKFKKILFFIRNSILNKKKTLVVCERKRINFFRKKFRGKYIRVCKDFYNGYFSNKKKKTNDIKNVISFGKVSDYIFNETKTNKMKGILFSMVELSKSIPDIHMLVNTDLKSSINFLSNQIVNVEKKYSYNYPFFNKKKRYYFCEKKLSKKVVILVLEIEQDLFVNKKYFSLTIKKMINNFFVRRKGNLEFIKKEIKKLCQFYNEKIKIVGIKIINCRRNFINFYLHNNKKLSFCIYKKKTDKEIVKKIIMNAISMEDKIREGYLKEDFIFDNSVTIGKIINRSSMIKIFFVR
ncbi:hypothetical protein VFPYRCLA_169 [Candidatus Vidania fulgoroideae]|nr:hypothetical protein VFPYRCLA_169 [Candidatus Vidania fulgoroideae]